MEYQKVGASDGMGTVIADNAAMFHRIAELEAQLAACQQEIAEYKSIIEEAQKQEPFLYVYNTNAEHRELEYQVIAKEHQNDPDVIKLYRAPIPAQQSPVVPEGWQLVPIEPTKKMIKDGAWREYYEESSNSLIVDDDDVISVWKDMLAAAPKPEGD